MDNRKKFCTRARHCDLALRKHGFEIGEEIGVGAFAKVKIAKYIKNPDDKCTVAVKIINLKKAPKVYQNKFLPRELNIWPQLEHSNIIKVYSIVSFSDHNYVFMEYAESGDIVGYLQKYGKIPEHQVKVWIMQLLQALLYCHKKGVAHRDVKCENLLLDRDLNLKLSDFGFSKHCLDNKFKRMLSSTFCGTMQYVPPEIIRGFPYNAFRSDVWSVGICTYVMLYDRLPYNTNNMLEFYKEQIQHTINFPPGIHCNKKCKEFIVKCLHPNPVRRPTVSSLTQSLWFRNEW